MKACEAVTRVQEVATESREAKDDSSGAHWEEVLTEDDISNSKKPDKIFKANLKE